MGGVAAKAADTSEDTVYVKVKFINQSDTTFDNLDIHVWGSSVISDADLKFTGEDSEGKYIILAAKPSDELGFIIRCYGDWSDGSKFVEADVKPDLSNGNLEYTATIAADGERTLETREPKDAFDSVTLRVHYARLDNDYTGWDIWSWPGTSPTDFSGTDDFGVYGDAIVGELESGTQVGVIVRKNDWSDREATDLNGGDRLVDTFFLDADGNGEIYVVSGQKETYFLEADASAVVEALKNPRVTSAVIDSMTEINFATNQPVTLEEENANVSVVASDDTVAEISDVVLAADGKSGTITLAGNLDLSKTYSLAITGLEGAQLSFGRIYTSEAFEQLYTYDGELGAVYSAAGTKFVLWSPSATSVKLALYGTDGSDYTSAAAQTLNMERGEKGSWTVTVPGDLNGTFYNYLVTVGGRENEVVDPYAKAVGVNGDRGMVIDLDTTNPQGWAADVKPALANATDAIIYEMHIRDFSIDDSAGVSSANQGKYAGVWESGTTIPGEQTSVSTGVDHLKELGVNVVHILPSFDYASVDETNLETPQFNWGYDPKNYNVPEGSYSSDPYAGGVRIEEFKQMVMELHKAGIRVVMDVVYNHTAASNDSNLNLAVPNYYYRQNAAGGFSNGSGCGNEMASDRSMCGRLIEDSVLYWAQEYHIDGFRFDLMAVHDIDTLKSIRAKLDTVDSSILMYGEGWTGGDCALDSELQATKANTVKFDNLQIAAFSDDIRDGIKGHVFNAEGQGFISGGEDYEETVKFGIVASTRNDQIDYSKVKNGTQPWANQPYQTISYVSAHDNLTLWDKLHTSNKSNSEEEILAMNKMAAAIVYTSQGIPFMQAGEELARTKTNADGSFNENSYNSPDSVNAIDWTRKITYSDLYEYYKGLIAMRKEHKAFHMNSTANIQAGIRFMDAPTNVVAYTLDGSVAGDSWRNIVVAFNANPTAASLTIPAGSWIVVVDGDRAGVEELARVEGGTIEIPARTSYVLVDKNSFRAPAAGTGDSSSTTTSSNNPNKVTVDNGDGTVTETVTEKSVNASGKPVEVSTAVQKDASGAVLSTTVTTTIAKAAEDTSATVTVEKDAAGTVTEAEADVSIQTASKKSALTSDVVAQIEEAAGQKNVKIKMTALTDDGEIRYTVELETKDLTAGNELYIYKLDAKTGEYVMVNAKTYKVTGNGSMSISITNKADYALVGSVEAKQINNAIKKTVAPAKASASVKKGKTKQFTLSSELNMKNVKSITYTTTKPSVATVTKNGKIKTVKKGTVTIKAKVTLKNGMTKTIKMKITVK
ncbi:MAG: type I pullulanase [Blautia sp.]|nr:type I pullulanase [Blautia sp.]